MGSRPGGGGGGGRGGTQVLNGYPLTNGERSVSSECQKLGPVLLKQKKGGSQLENKNIIDRGSNL